MRAEKRRRCRWHDCFFDQPFMDGLVRPNKCGRPVASLVRNKSLSATKLLFALIRCGFLVISSDGGGAEAAVHLGRAPLRRLVAGG